MKSISDKIYRFCHGALKIIAILFTGMLFLSGLLSNAYALDMDSQQVIIEWSNPILTTLGSIVLIAVVGGIFICLLALCRKDISRTRRLLRILVLCWCMGLSLLLVLFGKSAPAGDSYSVYNLAENIAMGNTSVIHATDSYISYYPQQIGLIALWEPIMRVVNLLPVELPAYHFIKLFYGFLACAIIFFQEKTVHILWNNEKADCIYLLAAGANVPLIMYTSFIYSEIPSYAAITVGIYLLTKLLTDSRHLFTAAGSILFLALGVMVRKNSLIFIIAAIIVVLLWALYRRRMDLLIYAVFCVLCCTSILPVTEKVYELRSGNEISTGVTATSYFAMGMQEASRAKGWYNAFNIDTYRESGMISEIANEISRRAISERLEYFRSNPGYAATFYLEKYLSQWADGSYACRQASLADWGGRSDFFNRLYAGDYSNYLIAYCDAYQNLIYLGVFCFCLPALKKKAPAEEAHSLPVYLGLIAVLGGFLFHMLWEANSRYIFPYSLSLLPYAAYGLVSCANYLIIHFSAKNNTKVVESAGKMP